MLFLTDLNSRIPVHVGNSSVRAILAGDNGPVPHLVFVPAGAAISTGDVVTTSGTGGLFPRGLKIGVVGHTATLEVKLDARLENAEYLSVLFFESPERNLADPDGSSRPKDRLTRRLLSEPGAATQPEVK